MRGLAMYSLESEAAEMGPGSGSRVASRDAVHADAASRRAAEAACPGCGLPADTQSLTHCLPPMAIGQIIYNAVRRLRWFIVVFWVSLAAFWGAFGIAYMTANTSSTFDPPPSTQAYRDMLIFSDAFPQLANQSTIVVLLQVQSTSSRHIDTNETIAFTDAVERWFWTYNYAETFLAWASFERAGMTSLARPMLSRDLKKTVIVMNINGMDLHLVNVFTDSFFANKDAWKVQYLPPDVDILLTGFPVEVRDSRMEGKSLMAKMDSIILPLALIILMLFVRSWRLILVPCATIGVSILSSYAVGAGLIAMGARVPDFSVTLMSSAVIAMGIDYSLFLLTRFRLETRRGNDTMDSTRVTISTAGKNVLFSGLIVSICFSGTVLLPSDLLSGLGLIAGSAVFVTVIVNLTLAPALLLCFPAFFGKFFVVSGDGFLETVKSLTRGCFKRGKGESQPAQGSGSGSGSSYRYGSIQSEVESIEGPGTGHGLGPEPGPAVPEKRRQRQMTGSESNSDDLSDVVITGDAAAADVDVDVGVSVTMTAKDEVPGNVKEATAVMTETETQALLHARVAAARRRVSSSGWYKLGRLSTEHPVIVIVLVLGAMAPFGIQLIWMTDEISFLNMVPADGFSVKGLRGLQDAFSPGFIGPYTIMIDGRNVGHNFTVCSDTFFTLANAVLRQIVHDVDNVTLGQLQSVVHIPVLGDIHWSFANLLLNRPDVPIYHQDEGLSYRYAWAQAVNRHPANTSMVIRLTLDVDPFADTSRKYLDQLRTSLSRMPLVIEGAEDMTFHLLGPAAVMFDLADLVFSLLPFMCSVTVGVCVLISAVAFRSAFLPLRVGITSLVAVVWSYGICILIFQYGWLDWLVPAYKASTGLYWVTPITSLCLILGLGLDYEIFLLISVVEIRLKGYSDKDSIVKGVYRTGGVISAAGLIMTLAFGSLLLSSSMVNNEYALLICFAVLLDAFVVRTFLVPSIMTLMGPMNWWPLRVPKPFKTHENVFDLQD